MSDVNEPKNNEYRKLKELFNIYLRNPGNEKAELNLKNIVISGEELIYLLDNYLNKTRNLEDAINSLVEECNSLVKKLEDPLKDKTGTLVQDLKSAILIYKYNIKHKEDNIKKLKANQK